VARRIELRRWCVLLGLHIATPTSRAVSFGVLTASLVVTWLGVELVHG
jgi:hypothetical protein